MPKLEYLKEATQNLCKIDGITMVGCIYCTETYMGDKSSFGICVDNGVCETLICKRCDVDAVIPIVIGSALYNLTQEQTIAQLVAWRIMGFGV